VNLGNVNDFLALDNVMCVGGSWIVPKQALRQKRFEQITALSREALQIIAER